jgi:hypothetical protein
MRQALTATPRQRASPPLQIFVLAGASPARVQPAASASPAGGRPGGSPTPDLPRLAAPAVQQAQQVARGRLPLPTIRLLEGGAGAAAFTAKLVPLHREPMEAQLGLLPSLRKLTPSQHGELIEVHRRWAAAAAAAGEGEGEGQPRQQQQQQRPGGGVADADPTLLQWCAAHGVVLPMDGAGSSSGAAQ